MSSALSSDRSSRGLTGRGGGRRVVVLTVNHVRVDGHNYAGGAEKYAHLTIRALLDAGVEVLVAYSGESIHDSLAQADRTGRLTITRSNWVNTVGSGDSRLDVPTIRERRRWLRQTGADTLFAIQQFGGGAFGASLLAGRLSGMRVVTTIRQMPVPPPAPTAKRWLGVIPSPELWRRRLIWRRRMPAWCCHAIIFNSQRVADDHHRCYGHPRHRVRIIHNGETVRPGVGATGRPTSIASVGRVTEAKGADVLLDAFERIARNHPDTTLTYIGDGPLIPTLKDRARSMGLDRRVRFTGYRDDPERIYRDIDVYVQPSRRESMSNSVIEAMARGIPCVVADVGGLPETVVDGRSGFVVPPAAPGGFADAIERLLADGALYARFSEAGLRRVREDFSLDRVMAETVETILGLAPEAV